MEDLICFIKSPKESRPFSHRKGLLLVRTPASGPWSPPLPRGRSKTKTQEVVLRSGPHLFSRLPDLAGTQRAPLGREVLGIAGVAGA